MSETTVCPVCQLPKAMDTIEDLGLPPSPRECRCDYIAELRAEVERLKKEIHDDCTFARCDDDDCEVCDLANLRSDRKRLRAEVERLGKDLSALVCRILGDRIDISANDLLDQLKADAELGRNVAILMASPRVSIEVSIDDGEAVYEPHNAEAWAEAAKAVTP